MKQTYIITIRYYGEKTKQLEITKWCFIKDDYIAYTLLDGKIRSTKRDRIIKIEKANNGKV